jgi:hypothetical protein
VLTTGPATNVASFSAILNGLLDPDGLTTTVHFQYGTTTSYGLTTAAQAQTGNTIEAPEAQSGEAATEGLPANHANRTHEREYADWGFHTGTALR